MTHGASTTRLEQPRLAESAPRTSIRFGEFKFAPAQRLLEHNGVAVELSSRAIDILTVLTERPGEVITKRELLARAWPRVFVDETAVRYHMVALRRALGDAKGGGRFIKTQCDHCDGSTLMSIIVIAKLLVPAGTPLQLNCGETFCPPHRG